MQLEIKTDLVVDSKVRLFQSELDRLEGTEYRARMQGAETDLSPLSELATGEAGILEELNLPEATQTHLMHMGFVPEAQVRAIRRAPAGDPTVYAVDGLEIALRKETAQQILVRPNCHCREERRGN